MKEHRSYQKSAEGRVTEANERLALAEEKCGTLSEELKILHEKFSLDLDEKTQRLQMELQVKKNK